MKSKIQLTIKSFIIEYTVKPVFTQIEDWCKHDILCLNFVFYLKLYCANEILLCR